MNTIENIYAFVMDDDEGKECILCLKDGRQSIPLICRSEEQKDHLTKVAKALVDEMQKPARLVLFTNKSELLTLMPSELDEEDF